MLADLADACGRLPLALRIAAAKCAEQPHRELRAYVAAFTARGRLGELDVDDDPQASVRTAFAMSYRRLARPHRVLFRRLGLVPGYDVTAALDSLTAAHMVERHGDRYSMHDLLRAYAGEKARRVDPAPLLEAAVGRLCPAYRAGVEGAARLLCAHMLRLPPDADAPEPRRSANTDEARAWLDAELANLLALVRHAARTGRTARGTEALDERRGGQVGLCRKRFRRSRARRGSQPWSRQLWCTETVGSVNGRFSAVVGGPPRPT